MQVQHIYREANECVDALTKRGAYQQQLLSVYNICLNFVYLCYARDLASLGVNRLCARRSSVGDV